MLGWLQSSAGSCIAALPCETAASDCATNFFSAADNTGVWGIEMDTRIEGHRYCVLGTFSSAVACREKRKKLPPHFHYAVGAVTVISICLW